MPEKISRDGKKVTLDLGNGVKRSITHTPAGLRVNDHFGGVTVPQDPKALGIEAVKSSEVGGAAARVTLKHADGSATDYTGQPRRSAGEVKHVGGSSRPSRAK